MRRLLLAAAALALLRADMYPDASNAKLPEAQRNLGQMASITPQMYGAKGDGTTDDTVAVQNWLNDLKTGAFVGNCQGKFRLTASVNAFPVQPYRVIGAGQGAGGCNFHIDYNSNWAGNAIDLTNPAAPTTRGNGADWSSMYITYNTALTSPPRAFGGDYISDALLRDIKISQYTVNRGQCMSWLQPWNIRQFTNISIWGCGGHASNHLVPAGTTFSIAAASTTLTSSASFFSAADVGRYITCQGSTYFEAWRIAAYIDPTNVTVNRPASAAHTANLCGINGITGSMTAGSPTLTISAASLTANDVGRVVYIPSAGGITAGITRTALRTTITAVSGTTITLAANAAGAVTDMPVILSPPIEIINANDMVLNELNLEQNAGTMLVIIDSANVRMSNSKLHAYGGASMGQTNGGETNFNAAIFNSFPTIEGTDIEATPVGGIGRVLISGIAGGFSIGSTTGILTTGLPHYALIGNAATSGFSFGPINGASRVDAAWLAGGVANLVYNDGTSLGALTLGPVTSYNSGSPMPRYVRGLGIPTAAADFGFVGDGATTSITTTAASAAFSPALPASAIGKAIIVPGAGANGDPHVTTIATTTTFAAPAVTASSPSTWYADKGRACPVATSQSGAGNYQPNDTVTLGTAACKVSYTQIVGTPTIVNGGTGCTNGANLLLVGTTGAGDSPILANFRVFATIAGGTVTAITGIWWPGRYRVNPTNLADEPVTGANCTGVRLAIPKMGVGLAYVSQPGGVPTKPADPVAQTATSGAGTGATFTMTDVWRAAGEAHWGTDNTAAVTALAASTSGPTVHFPAGTYLYNCGNYNMASAISLIGDGMGKSNLKLFPYCDHSGILFTWGTPYRATIDGMTFDNNRAYNTTAPALRTALSVRSDNFRFSNNSIINMRPMSLGLAMTGAGGTGALLNPVIKDNYFHFLNPDPTATEAIHVSNIFGAAAGITGAVISGNYADGAGIDFCLDGGVVSNNEVTRTGYGTGFYGIPDPMCRNTLITNNVAHDSILNTDVNLTKPSGFEINGDNVQVTGNLAYRNGGNGFRISTNKGFISGNTAWSNVQYQPPEDALYTASASGFYAIGPNANGSVFVGNNAYDGGDGKQLYGYSETGAAGSLTTVKLINNNFTGPSGAIGARAVGSITPAVTVATLPACNAANKYLTQQVSDQSGVPTYRGALTGGGAIAVLAYCNGTSWEAH